MRRDAAAGIEQSSSRPRQALKSHRVTQDSKTFRERTVFVFGDEAGANDMYFELSSQIRRMENGGEDEIPVGVGAKPSCQPSTAGQVRAVVAPYGHPV